MKTTLYGTGTDVTWSTEQRTAAQIAYNNSSLTRLLELKAKAEHGDPVAACQAGMMYHLGLKSVPENIVLVPKDEKEAVRLYELAVHNGSTVAADLIAAYKTWKQQDETEKMQRQHALNEQHRIVPLVSPHDL